MAAWRALWVRSMRSVVCVCVVLVRDVLYYIPEGFSAGASSLNRWSELKPPPQGTINMLLDPFRTAERLNGQKALVSHLSDVVLSLNFWIFHDVVCGV